jgi:hypothetical protein
MGGKQTITPEMMRSGSKEQVILNIASTVLEDYFCQQMPDYPKFTLLTSVMTSTNRDAMLKSARNKIANHHHQSRNYSRFCDSNKRWTSYTASEQ